MHGHQHFIFSFFRPPPCLCSCLLFCNHLSTVSILLCLIQLVSSYYGWIHYYCDLRGWIKAAGSVLYCLFFQLPMYLKWTFYLIWSLEAQAKTAKTGLVLSAYGWNHQLVNYLYLWQLIFECNLCQNNAVIEECRHFDCEGLPQLLRFGNWQRPLVLA